MNQSIKIIDEMIERLEKLKKGYSNKDLTGVYVHEKANLRIETLEEAKEKISSLPSLDIDSLQRYDCELSVDCPYMDENDNGEYVRYESLVDLLRN